MAKSCIDVLGMSGNISEVNLNCKKYKDAPDLEHKTLTSEVSKMTTQLRQYFEAFNRFNGGSGSAAGTGTASSLGGVGGMPLGGGSNQKTGSRENCSQRVGSVWPIRNIRAIRRRRSRREGIKDLPDADEQKQVRLERL